MGIAFSKAHYTDPSQFATPVDAEAPNSSAPLKEYKKFDYIVVGAGAAGAVIASRLSEDPNVTVLLVEAGGNNADSPFSKIPMAFAKQFKTPWDWEYYTTPQPRLNNRELFWPQGKMLGGSTSINAMMYHHCAPSDFDEWEKLGAEGWSYKDIAPYFRKSEKFTANVLYPDVNPNERGSEGLWHTGYHHCTKICSRFLDACAEVGVPINPDINTERGTLGVTKIATFVDPFGSRSSSATAYLTPAVVARKNLKIAINTQTLRVLFNKAPVPQAVGIEVGSAKDELSPRYRLSARKEIIICAGALATPKILNLSGIGAKAELDKFGIKVVKDLPAVGKNLSDHLVAGAITFRAQPGETLDYMQSDIKSLPSIIYWLFTGKGPASSNVAESAAFVRSSDPKLPFGALSIKKEPHIKDTTSGPNAPDLELIAAPVAFLDHGLTFPPPGSFCFTIAPILLRPLSLGSVYLKSVNPYDKAIIEPNYLADPNDMKILVKGLRLSLRIGRTSTLKPHLNLPNHNDADKTKNNIFWPGDADPDLVEDADLEEFVRNKSETLYHPVGTARMGKDEKTSVVGPTLKVHGTKGLRVVDASIFPNQISGHPTAPIIAIAEKAVEHIRKGK